MALPLFSVQGQRLPATIADPLLDALSAHQIGSDHKVFWGGEIQSHDLATPNVDYKLEIQPDPENRGGR